MKVRVCSSPDGRSPVWRRSLLGTAVLAVLVAVAGLVSYLARPDDAAAAAAPPRPPAAAEPSPTATPSQTGKAKGSPSGSVKGPPSTRDPLAFAKAAAVALWSYDTRTSSQPRHLARLHRWLSDEKKFTDEDSVDALVPSPLLWEQMAEQAQYATATASEARFPDAFTRALQDDPGKITTAYVYAVTVSGKQKVVWDGSPKGGAESRTVTLAVQCRPSQDCALAGVLPTVAP
ncbi:hypothetical protein H1V43_22240 [Streptomyces sp. PSKA54]|uniref:Uncharacterized protein n=1 Tax=Streptomyces himalayensis subsp. aureolus TaxID=2758039 RepID=A0A7W2D3C8_9ACTN|nr:hypothetical protein [Streptomyces himalayensis]MBA4864027.1 hypothetical protein [Streptomyces himalayensis subsp. aureolus]